MNKDIATPARTQEILRKYGLALKKKPRTKFFGGPEHFAKNRRRGPFDPGIGGDRNRPGNRGADRAAFALLPESGRL